MDRQDIHILRLMGEIDREGSPSQRELARRLNLSLGLINTFCRRLVNKGYFKVKTMPKNRVKYFLTPEGLARKSRLTVEYLRYSGKFYREVKGLLMNKFARMEMNRVASVLFFGAGEVAELAYLYLQLTPIRLVGVVDETCTGDDFFHFRIDGFDRLHQDDWDAVLLTRLEDTHRDRDFLMQNGVAPDRIEAL
ncbi:MAG: winged helix-turn-helix transcriptional regulator [Desulfobacteraceae bacterium]